MTNTQLFYKLMVKYTHNKTKPTKSTKKKSPFIICLQNNSLLLGKRHHTCKQFYFIFNALLFCFVAIEKGIEIDNPLTCMHSFSVFFSNQQKGRRQWDHFDGYVLAKQKAISQQSACSSELSGEPSLTLSFCSAQSCFIGQKAVLY